MKSIASHDGFNKSQLFTVREDGIDQSGNCSSPQPTPYVPYTLGKSPGGRASDAMARTWSEGQQKEIHIETVKMLWSVI